MTFPAAALTISAGVIIWALHFTALYGVTALACARGWEGVVPSAIAGATALAVVAAAAVMVAGWRRRSVFEYWLSATVAGFGLIAIVYEAIPVLVVPICG
jgi:hypothetical protein